MDTNHQLTVFTPGMIEWLQFKPSSRGHCVAAGLSARIDLHHMQSVAWENVMKGWLKQLKALHVG